MRKIYLSLIAIAIAFTASATTPRKVMAQGELKGNSPFTKTAMASIPRDLHFTGEKVDFAVKPIEKRNIKKAPEEAGEWEIIGEGSMQDFIIGQLFGEIGPILRVTVEQNVSDPTLYRIQEPYANWVDPEYTGVVTYNAENATPMIIHMYQDTYAWFDEFDTGLYLTTQYEGGGAVEGEIIASMMAEQVIEAYKGDVATVVTYAPNCMMKYNKGVFTLTAIFNDGFNNYYGLLLDIGEETFPGNKDGLFKLTIPYEGEPENWTPIGQGTYTDVVLSSFFQVTPARIPVTFEQSDDDPNTYRIVAPYDNWYDSNFDGIVTYNYNNATPMVFHIVDNKYVWFEEFNTGLYIDITSGSTTLKGDIIMLCNAETMIQINGIETIIQNLPASLGKYNQGNITWSANFNQYGQIYSNILLAIGNKNSGFYTGNSNGQFLILMPNAAEVDPNEGWTTLEGKALYTDTLTELFVMDDDAEPQVLEVEMQRNDENPNIFRLVNPYATWQRGPGMSDITYDKSQNYYMEIHTFPEKGLAYFEDFYTGLQTALGPMGVTTDAAYYGAQYGIDRVISAYPDMLGGFYDGVFTYGASYLDDNLEPQPTILLWFGYNDDSDVYLTNQSGKFKVVFPANYADSGVENVISAEDVATEYYTLQGVKVANPEKGTIVIVKKGNQVKKQVF